MSDIRRAHEEEQEEARRQSSQDRLLEAFRQSMRQADEDYRKAQRRIARDTWIMFALLLLIVAFYVVVMVLATWRAS